MCQCNDGVLVSVVIPLYNKAPYIKRAIDSVLNQTVQNFEIIIVGGRSTDGGEEIVQTYTDSRIKLVMEIGKGVSAARNQGVNCAESEVVAFLDADDEWCVDYLETILDLKIKFPDAGMFATGHNLIKNQRSHIHSYMPEKKERLFSSYFQERVTSGINYHLIMTSAVSVNKHIFQKINGFNTSLSYGEDVDLYERLSIVTKIAYSPKVCVKYNYDIPNNTRTHVSFRNPFTFEIIDKLQEDVKNTGDCVLNIQFNRYVKMVLISWSFQNALRGHRKESMSLLKKAKCTKYIHIQACTIILNMLPRKILSILMKWHYSF